MSAPFTYSSLWDQYPDYINYPDSAEVKEMIGGNVNGTWITNTCAIRLSRALNYNGTPVPGNYAGLVTVKGGDGKRYALRVREMDAWLRFAFGKPDFESTKKAGAAFDKSSISTLKGIIGFDIRFVDATGHLDLWDGAQFSSEYKTTGDYFKLATRIWLWKLKG
jgi:hypothetical protein